MKRSTLSAERNIHRAKICLFGDLSSVHLVRWATGLKSLGCNNISVVSYRKATLPSVKAYDISCSEMRKNRRYEKYIRILRGIKMFLMLRRALRSIKPDIVHVHYLINTPLVFGFLGLKNLIVSPWGYDLIYDYGREPITYILYKKLIFKWAKKVTATTHFLSKHIQRYTHHRPVVIAFGVDTSIFIRSKNRRHKGITISFVKHLKEKYGPRYLIEAIHRILKRYKNIKVNLVGSGPQETYLKKLVDKLGLQSYIYFLGKITHEQVVDILQETDIFVMPSIFESEVFGVAAIEASAMEIPVIASNLGGIREAVIDGKTGILVSPRDTKAIAEACLKLIRNSKLRHTLGKNGRKFVKTHFEWCSCIEKMKEVYVQTLNMN